MSTTTAGKRCKLTGTKCWQCHEHEKTNSQLQKKKTKTKERTQFKRDIPLSNCFARTPPSDHAIDTRECVSLVHYKQTDAELPYKSTLNLVPCGRRNQAIADFSNVGAASWASALATLLVTSFDVEDAFRVSKPMETELSMQMQVRRFLAFALRHVSTNPAYSYW